MSVVENPLNFHPYYPSAGIENDIPNIVTQSIAAYKDENGVPQTLTVGASSDLNLESEKNVNVYLGSNNAYTLYTSTYQSGVRTDTEILAVDRNVTTNTTVISAPENVQITSADVANSTFTVGSLELSQDASAQVIDTAMNNFRFTKGMQIQGDVAVANNIISSGNIYGANVNLWMDKVDKDYTRIGYGMRINNMDQLEIIKYAKFSSNDVLKKVAVFGAGNTTAQDASDASYLVFDALGNVSVASSNGALNPVASTNASSGSNMTLSGPTTLSGDILPSANFTYSIGSGSAKYLRNVYTSNIVFPTSQPIVNGSPLLSDALSSSSSSNAATSAALSNAYNVGVVASSTAASALSTANTANTTAQWSSNNFGNYLPLVGGSVTGDLTVGGSLTVSGPTTTVDTQNVLVKDNLLSINSSLSNGTPPSTLQSGIEVYRGSLPKYYFLFDEASSLFKIGLSNQLQAVTTRVDGLTSGFPYYDAATSRLVNNNMGTSNIVGLNTILGTTSNTAIFASNAIPTLSNQAYLWTSNGSNLYFSSTNNSNYVGIGFSNPAYKLAVNGQIYSSDDIIAFSDRRVKDNLQVIPNALSKLLALNGYTYTRVDNMDTARRYAGVVAQEVNQVLPEVIHTDPAGYMSVAYGNMMSLVIEAIKDLNTKIDSYIATHP